MGHKTDQQDQLVNGMVMLLTTTSGHDDTCRPFDVVLHHDSTQIADELIFTYYNSHLIRTLPAWCLTPRAVLVLINSTVYLACSLALLQVYQWHVLA